MARDTVAEIKDRLSIADVINQYVKLSRAGKSLRGLCPFHKEKTPSFHVSPDRGSWHCFGCGEGGDMFTFIEKIEGVEFKDALKILADKAGVSIEYSPGVREDVTKKERHRSLMNRASEWYASQLLGSPAQVYAQSRGLSGDTVAAWRLGYAPDGWRELLEALTKEGFTIEEMLAVGLIKEADGKPGTYYDRFRNRLMFPIRDVSGRVVAFTGRALTADDSAKYLNSPETELYHKSEILFGLDRAKDAIRTRRFAMLVEGQIDVLHAHQEGFTNAIALSGTALTERHIALMKRYTENLMLVLDADVAGLKATARSAAIALINGLRVKATALPKGKDPADVISEDPQDFAKRVTSAKPIVEFFMSELMASNNDQHRLLRSTEEIILPLIVSIRSPMEREHSIQIVARSLGLSSEAVKESLARLPRETVNLKMANQTEKTTNLERVTSEMREEQLLAVIQSYRGTPLADTVKKEYLRITEATELPAVAVPESALFFVEQLFGESPEKDAADELLHAFESAIVREAYQEALNDLRRAEASNDPARITEAQKRCTKLQERLASL